MKAKVQLFWYEIVAHETQLNGNLYEHRMFKRAIDDAQAIQLFWHDFCDWRKRDSVRKVEILRCLKVKKQGERTTQKWINGRFKNLPFLEEFARR